MAKTTKKNPFPSIEGDEGAVSPAFAAFFRSALLEQRERIRVGVEKAGDAFWKSPSNAKGKAKQFNDVFKLKIVGLNGESQKFRFRGALKDVNVVGAIALWISASSHSVLAGKALDCADFNSALTHFGRAERSIGAANSQFSNKAFVSLMARLKARAGHASTYAMESAVVAYWKTHIDQSLSAPKAADQMFGIPQFRWEGGGDVSHKFLANCVRTERKRLTKK